jgi:hypothetical protein
MRTIDFETILAQGLQLAGLDRDNVNEQDFNQIRDFANFRLKRAWEYDVWPDLVRITAFPVVNSNNIHYVVIPNNGIVTNTAGTFKVSVGDIMQVTKEDPRGMGKHTVVGFSIDEVEQAVSGNVYTTVRRVILDAADTTEVYLTYRLECPEFIGNLYVSGNNYYQNQIVYWAYQSGKYFAPTSNYLYSGKKGNFWKCLVNTTSAPNVNGNSEPAATDQWDKIKIPAFLGQYLIKGIHADWLKSEMQIELGQAMEAEAQSLLDFEIQKVIVQQGRSPKLNFNQIY